MRLSSLPLVLAEGTERGDLEGSVKEDAEDSMSGSHLEISVCLRPCEGCSFAIFILSPLRLSVLQEGSGSAGSACFHTFRVQSGVSAASPLARLHQGSAVTHSMCLHVFVCAHSVHVHL